MRAMPKALGRAVGGTLWTAARGMRRHKASLLASALSFFTLVSTAPLAIVLLAAAGAVSGEAEAGDSLTALAVRALGPQAARLFEHADSGVGASGGVLATLVAVAIVLYGAARLFLALQFALDSIWDVPRETTRARRFRAALRSRALSFALVVVLALCGAAAVLADGAVGLVRGEAAPQDSPWIDLAEGTIAIVAMWLVFGATYHWLPKCRVSWRRVWPGAGLTAVLVFAGQDLLEGYLERIASASTLGAAGSALAFPLWLYGTWMLFLFGAEITRAMDGGGRRTAETER